MAETAVIFTPKYYEHNTGPGHPETRKRVKVIIRKLEELNLFSSGSNCELVDPQKAKIGELRLVHTRGHIQLVKRTCELGGGLLDTGDTVVSRKSFETAAYAVGGTLRAVDLVLKKRYKNAFALVRPPGHHAGSYYAMGFCIFNNIAVAASYLTEILKLQRVLILDIDAHHGNGTQEIFYSTQKVLYISLHEDPIGFPGTGFIDETGEGDGFGYNINIPFPIGVSDKPYMKAIDDIVVPVVKQYTPQFILVSAGFDGYYRDPIAQLSLSASIYAEIFRRIQKLAHELCEDRSVAVLEGGYYLRRLGGLVASAITKRVDADSRFNHDKPPETLKSNQKAQKILKEVEKVQSAFWTLGS